MKARDHDIAGRVDRELEAAGDTACGRFGDEGRKHSPYL
jgi:hypothetical protein